MTDYTPKFNKAFEEVVMLEGGYNDYEQDKGGATKYGISLRFLKLIDADLDGDGHVSQSDIKALTEENAKEFYHKHFWKHYKCESYRNAELSARIFSMLINMRSKQVGRILQRALRAVGVNVKEDGIVGPITRRHLNKCKLHPLMAAIRSEQAGFYRLVVQNDPTQAIFLKGWLARAYK